MLLPTASTACSSAGATPAGARAARPRCARRFAVVAGGPGTGKTTTVARIVALLPSSRGRSAPPLVALAAPTGKAAARLEEAVHAEAAMPDLGVAVREQLLGAQRLDAAPAARLAPGSHSRFRHDRGNRLPHDVVIVDETSMVSLTLMARLVEAVAAGGAARPGRRPGPARPRSRPAPCSATSSAAARRRGVVVLDHVLPLRRRDRRLAAAIRAGDGDAVIAALAGRRDDVTWIPVDAADPTLARSRRSATAPSPRPRGDRGGAAPATPRRAIAALGAFRLLCAHRRGPHGVAAWMARIEAGSRE